jgi:(p)ppGpp synthase/HD superfamily hydrolase
MSEEPRGKEGKPKPAAPEESPKHDHPGSVQGFDPGPLAPYSASCDEEGLMGAEAMRRLRDMRLAPYMQLATTLVGKLRRSGGNMFRHQIDTFGILMDYGYIDSVLLKASVIHDLLEDVPDFDRDGILSIDEESAEVYKLVLEVTRRPIETKQQFLERILHFGSKRAKVLKSADRISNMISLGFVTDIVFIKRYTDETEALVFPIAAAADKRMLEELQELVASRREYLARKFEI